MAQENDTNPKSNLPDIEERIRRFVSLFKGGHGDIKNKRLENLIKIGYSKDEAKKLYNFVENFKHLLPESKAKTPKTLKSFITKLILLAEVQPELVVALFGKDTDTILAELATKSAASQLEKMNNMSHPGISGQKKTLAIDYFNEEIELLSFWFVECISLRKKILEILISESNFFYLNPGSDKIQQLCDSLLSFLKQMSPRQAVLVDNNQNEKENENKPKPKTHIILQNAAKTGAYKYLLKVASNRNNILPLDENNSIRYLWNVPILFFQLDVFLSYIQIQILKRYFIFLDKYRITMFGYKTINLKSDCIGFKKEEVYKTYENIIDITKLLMKEEVFGPEGRASKNLYAGGTSYYIQRQKILYRLFAWFGNSCLEKHDISDKKTVINYKITEDFLVYLKMLEKTQVDNYENLKKKLAENRVGEISSTFNIFFNENTFKSFDMTKDLPSDDNPMGGIEGFYNSIREKLLKDNLISYSPPPKTKHLLVEAEKILKFLNEEKIINQ